MPWTFAVPARLQLGVNPENDTCSGRRLTFEASGSDFVDTDSSSRWNLFGHALTGPLAGRRLDPIVHGDDFWFAWAAFKPATRVYR